MKSLVMVLGVFGLLGAGGCSDKRDCDAYTTHYSSLSESAHASTSDTVRDMCEHGGVSDTEYKCVMAAQTHNELRKCLGLSPL
jgi:hypothetical protein